MVWWLLAGALLVILVMRARAKRRWAAARREAAAQRRRAAGEAAAARERQKLDGLVREHQAALSVNLGKALERNDYGAVVRDRTQDMLEEFYWSVGYERDRLAVDEARQCVFRALGRDDPGLLGPVAAKAGWRPWKEGGIGASVQAAGAVARAADLEGMAVKLDPPAAPVARMTGRERDHNDFGQIGEAMVIDVETTGLDAERDRIVSLSMIEVDLGRLTESGEVEDCVLRRMGEVFDPGMRIPRSASRIHGIRDADVKGKPSFDERAEEIRDVIGTLPLIGHNVSFDKKFLSAAFKRAGVKTLHRNRSHCTMWRYRTRHSGPSKLDAVVGALGLKGRSGPVHLAEEDTQLALAVACVFHLQDR